MYIMLFFFVVVFFWFLTTISVVLAVIFRKKKIVKKSFIGISIVLFSFPFLILLGFQIYEQVMAYKIKGEYAISNDESHTILTLSDDEEFTISSNKCPEETITGVWRYVNGEDEYLTLYSDGHTITTYFANDRNKLIFESDINTECLVLNNCEFIATIN